MGRSRPAASVGGMERDITGTAIIPIPGRPPFDIPTMIAAIAPSRNTDLWISPRSGSDGFEPKVNSVLEWRATLATGCGAPSVGFRRVARPGTGEELLDRVPFNRPGI